VRSAAFLILAAALVGCGSTETKEDPRTPVGSEQALAPPPVEAKSSPPFGQPKPTVAPGSFDKRDANMRETLLHDDSPR